MRSSQPLTTGFQLPNSVRSPEVSGSVRRPSSNDRFVARSFAGPGASEFPIVDSQARYSISYVPGMSEHMVNTGKTLPEAQLKVVLFACEVERLNTLNYNLVKENEILKAQNKKTSRESDLETKLAIVLAENEKLNQIVEELQSVYSRERDILPGEDDERRLNDLRQEITEWRDKYKRLEMNGSGSVTELRGLIEEQQRERESLRTENSRLRSELEAVKLGTGQNDGLRQSLSRYETRVRDLLAENDKLNNLLVEKSREQKEIIVQRQPVERHLNAVNASPVDNTKQRETIDKLTRDTEELRGLLVQSQAASTELRERVGILSAENERLNVELRTQRGGQNSELTARINTLLDENNRLNRLLESKSRDEDIRGRTTQLISENDRLNGLVYELRSDNERIKQQLAGTTGSNTQLNTLLAENTKLNDLLASRLSEIDVLKNRNRDLELRAGSVEDLKNKVGVLVSENDRLNGTIVTLMAENERLKREVGGATKVTELNAQISTLLAENRKLTEMTNKLTLVSSENERLNGLVVELRADNEKIRRDLSQSGSVVLRVEQLTTQVNSLLAENGKLNDTLGLRLREIEALRQRTRELEAQAAGAGQDTAKVNQLTLQINNLLDENRKLNDVLAAKAGDADGLRRRVTDLEAELVRVRRESVDTTQINQLNIQIAGLQEENRRIVEETERLRRRVPELEATVGSLSRQIGDAGQSREKIEHLTQQLNNLLSENQRLNTLLVEKHSESGRVTELNVQINKLLDENRRLNELLTSRLTEIDGLRKRIGEGDVQLATVNDLRGKLALVTSENERLTILITEQRGEIEKLRVQVAEGLRNSQATGQLNNLLLENNRLNEMLIQKAKEVDALRIKASEADQLIGKLALVTSENERLNTIIREQRAEIESLRPHAVEAGRVHEENKKMSRRVQDAENAANAQLGGLKAENDRLNVVIVDLRNEVERLRQQTGDAGRLHEALVQRSNEAEALRRRVTELEATAVGAEELRKRVSLADSEIGRLTIVINEHRAEIERLRQQSGDAGRLHEILAQRTSEAEALRRRVTELEAAAIGVDELRKRVSLADSEVGRLNIVITEHRAEIERLRQQSGDAGRLHEELRRLNELLVAKSREADDLRRRITELEGANVALNDLRNNLAFVNSEKERLTITVNQQREEIDRLRGHAAEAGRAHEENKKMSRRVQDTENEANTQLAALRAENERLSVIISEHRSEIDRLRLVAGEAGRSQELSLQIARLQEENSKLRGSLVLITAENERLTTLVQRMDSEIQGLRIQVTEAGRSSGNVEHLNSRILVLTGDVERLNAHIMEIQRENERLRIQVTEAGRSSGNVEHLNSRILVLTGDVERLNAHIVEIQRENERLRIQISQLQGGDIQINKLTLQVNTLLAENARLTESLSHRIREVEELRARPLTTTVVSSAGEADLRASLVLLAAENERLNALVELNKSRVVVDESAGLRSTLHSLTIELEDYKRRYLEAQTLVSQNEELRKKIQVLTLDSQSFNGLLSDRVREIESLKLKVYSLESSASEVSLLRSRISQLELSLASINDLRATVVLLAAENERLSGVRTAPGGYTDTHTTITVSSDSATIEALRASLDRANALLLEKTREVESYQLRVAQLETSTRTEPRGYTDTSTAITVSSDSATVEVLRASLERANALVLEKSREVENAKARITQLETSTRTEPRGYTDTTVTISSDAGTVEALRANIVLLNAENERMSHLLHERSREVDAYKQRIQELQTASGESQRTVTVTTSADASTIEALKTDLEKAHNLLLAKSREIETYQARLSETGAKTETRGSTETSATVTISSDSASVEVLKANIERANALLLEKSREIENYQARIAQLESGGNVVNTSTTSTANVQSGSVVEAFAKELEAAKKAVSEKNNEIETLKKKLAGDQNAELRSRVEVLLNQNEELNNHLSDKMREIAALRRQVAELEGKNPDEIKEEEEKGLLATVKEKIVHGIEKLTGKDKDEEDKSTEYKAQIEFLETERDTLKRMLEEKTNEVERLRSGDVRTVEGPGAEGRREVEGHKKAGVLPGERTPGQRTPVEGGRGAESVDELRGEIDKWKRVVAEREREIRELGGQVSEVKHEETVVSVGKGKEEAEAEGEVEIRIEQLKGQIRKLDTVIAEKDREIEGLRGRLSESEELAKRSGNASTSTMVTANVTERGTEEVESLKRRILELEKSLSERSGRPEETKAEGQRQGEGEREAEETKAKKGIIEAVKEKIAHGIEKLTGGTHMEGSTGDLEAAYSKLLDEQISDVAARFNEEKKRLERNEENLNLKIQELEENVRLLTDERDKLTASNDKNKQEIENWKRRYEHFENQKDMDMDALKSKLEKQYRESPSRKDIPEQVIDLEDRVTYLNNEIERLQDHLNMTLTELEEWRKRYSELEVLRAQEIDELRQQFDNAKKSSIEGKELQVKFNAERTAYEAQILQLQQRIGELQSQIKLVTSENERLNKLSINRLEELEDLRRSQGGSGTSNVRSSQTLEIAQLKTQLENYKASSHNVKQLAIKYSAEKAADLSQIRQLKQVNENLKSELEKLYELLDERKADFESLTRQNEDLLKMYEKLVSQSTEQGVDFESSQERSYAQKEISELESTKDEIKAQYQRNSLELTRKNKELVDKLQELDILKMKYEEALANYQALNGRLFEKLNSER